MLLDNADGQNAGTLRLMNGLNKVRAGTFFPIGRKLLRCCEVWRKRKEEAKDGQIAETHGASHLTEKCQQSSLCGASKVSREACGSDSFELDLIDKRITPYPHESAYH